MNNVDIKSLVKTFKTNAVSDLTVLDNISFTINAGEFLSIVGPSGCGKSTLLKIIAGLEKADNGTIQFDPVPSIVPIIWQEHRLFPWLTVMKNIKFGLEISRTNKVDITEKAFRYLELVNLGKFENYYPSQLSAGMAQRVAIARALAINSNFILMDEPFASIDYLTKINLLKEITNIQHNNKVTIVYVTHDIRDAISYSDRVLILSKRPARLKSVIEINEDLRDSRQLEKQILETIGI